MVEERQGNGMGTAWERHGMCESNTAALVNQMGKTQSNDLAERHGRGTAGEQQGNGMGTAWELHGNGMGTAWERHGMCESALKLPCNLPALRQRALTSIFGAQHSSLKFSKNPIKDRNCYSHGLSFAVADAEEI
jgi:hypothetical protein